MKKLIILILIFNVFCSCEKEKKEIYKYNKNIKLRSEVQKLVNELHIYPSISGNKTNESENKTYKNLLDIATNQELVELTDRYRRLGRNCLYLPNGRKKYFQRSKLNKI